MFRRKFFLSYRMAFLAVLFSCFLTACPGEEENQCFGPSGPVECMDIPYKDSHNDGVTNDSADAIQLDGSDKVDATDENADVEKVDDPCEEVRWVEDYTWICGDAVIIQCQPMEIGVYDGKCYLKCWDGNGDFVFALFVDQLTISPPPNPKITWYLSEPHDCVPATNY